MYRKAKERIKNEEILKILQEEIPRANEFIKFFHKNNFAQKKHRDIPIG